MSFDENKYNHKYIRMVIYVYGILFLWYMIEL